MMITLPFFESLFQTRTATDIVMAMIMLTVVRMIFSLLLHPDNHLLVVIRFIGTEGIETKGLGFLLCGNCNLFKL